MSMTTANETYDLLQLTFGYEELSLKSASELSKNALKLTENRGKATTIPPSRKRS